MQHIISCLRDSYETILRESLLSHKLPIYSPKSYGLWYERLLRSLGKHYMCINYCQWLSYAYLANNLALASEGLYSKSSSIRTGSLHQLASLANLLHSPHRLNPLTSLLRSLNAISIAANSENLLAGYLS